jgi:serine/threonine-protein kinase ULK2
MQRDLKPGNILLSSAGGYVSAKIADFGFARILETARLAHTLCGSPLYMAPEVLSEQQYDSRSDLWSVGVMMFEMLVGHVPFSGNNIVHLKKVIDNNEAFLPFDMRERLSPACQVRAILS